ncbi:MAG: type II toxin-antitoxin system RelB/DinJ family antitoxin [bacterium]
MNTIQIRIDEKEKRAAKKILDRMGLDMSSAIKLFLKQLSVYKGLPFLVVTENGLTISQEKNIIRAANDAIKNKNVSKKMNGKQAAEYLKAL